MDRRLALFTFGGLIIAAVIAAGVAPFASQAPDGLEKVAEDQGFHEESGAAPVWRFALFPDYAAPGVHNEVLATGLAGLAGALATFGAALALMKLRARWQRTRSPRGEER